MPNLNSIYPLEIPTIKRYTLPRNIGSVSSTPLIEKSNEIISDSTIQNLVIQLANKELVQIPNFPPIDGYVTRGIDFINSNNFLANIISVKAFLNLSLHN